MTRVLYVNHAHSEICGVHDLGRRHAAALADVADIRYVETNTIDGYGMWVEDNQPDVIFINYMPGIMPWVGPDIAQVSTATRVAVIHNFQADTIDQVVQFHVAKGFDFVLALDPTLQTSNQRVLTTERPLPPRSYRTVPDPLAVRPRIGSAGFAFPHKDFPAVAREIADTVPDGTFALHMPEAYFNGVEGQPLFTDGIMSQIAVNMSRSPHLTVDFTDDYVDADTLVDRLARNHVNCLFYVPGQHNAGLSSQLDYMIAACRPTMVTDCAMFAHYGAGLIKWPDHRLNEVLDNYDHYAAQAITLYESIGTLITEQTAAHLERIAP